MEDPSPLKSLLEWLIPVVTIGLVVFVQAMFWLPSFGGNTAFNKSIEEAKDEQKKETQGAVKESSTIQETKTEVTETNTSSTTGLPSFASNLKCVVIPPQSSKSNSESNNSNTTNNNKNMNIQINNGFRCPGCEGGFLPQGMFTKTFGSAEAILKLGTGQCYHKQM